MFVMLMFSFGSWASREDIAIETYSFAGVGLADTELDPTDFEDVAGLWKLAVSVMFSFRIIVAL